MPDITRTGRGVVALLLMRTVLLFVGTGVVLPFVGWIYNRALLWADVTVVIVDVITLLVLSQMLARQNRRLRDLLAPSRLGTAWGLLAFIMLFMNPPHSSPRLCTPPGCRRVQAPSAITQP